MSLAETKEKWESEAKEAKRVALEELTAKLQAEHASAAKEAGAEHAAARAAALEEAKEEAAATLEAKLAEVEAAKESELAAALEAKAADGQAELEAQKLALETALQVSAIEENIYTPRHTFLRHLFRGVSFDEKSGERLWGSSGGLQGFRAETTAVSAGRDGFEN